MEHLRQHPWCDECGSLGAKVEAASLRTPPPEERSVDEPGRSMQSSLQLVIPDDALGNSSHISDPCMEATTGSGRASEEGSENIDEPDELSSTSRCV